MKLNKKGFTLVELLAVIIILAIVIGITIPAVLKTITKSRISGGEDAAEIVANWIDDQYVLVTVDSISVDEGFKAVCGPTGSLCTSGIVNATAPTADDNTYAAFYSAVGLKVGDVTNVAVKIDGNSKSCVTLTLDPNRSYYISSVTGSQTVEAGKGCGHVAAGQSAK